MGRGYISVVALCFCFLGFAAGQANQPPVVTTAAPSQFAMEDQVHIFDRVFDVTDDVQDPSCELQLTAESLNLVGFLAFWPNGGGSSMSPQNQHLINMQGTLAQIDWALANLQYTPVAGFTGVDTVRVTVDDRGSCYASLQRKSAFVDVTLTVQGVNDPPALSVQGRTPDNYNWYLTEDSSSTPISVYVSDIDVGTGDLEVNVTVVNGYFVFSNPFDSSITVVNNMTGFTTFRGTMAALNTHVFGNMVFVPTLNFVGNAAAVVAVSDLGNTGLGGPLSDSITLFFSVSSVLDPILIITSPMTINEDDPCTLWPIVLDDQLENNIQQEVIVTVAATCGTFQFGSAMVSTRYEDGSLGTTDHPHRYHVQGTQEEVTKALNLTCFAPNPDYFGSCAITITFVDYIAPYETRPVRRQKTSYDAITVNGVNDAPYATGTQQTFTTGRDQTFDMPDDVIIPVDMDANREVDIMTITFNSTNGELTIPELNGQVTTSTNPITISATLQQLQWTLSHLRYRSVAPYMESNFRLTDTNIQDTIIMSINDGGSSGSGGPMVGTVFIQIVAHVERYLTCQAFLDVNPSHCGCYFMSSTATTQTPWVPLPSTFPSEYFLFETAPRRFAQGCCNDFTFYESGVILTNQGEMSVCSYASLGNPQLMDPSATNSWRSHPSPKDTIF